MFLSTHTGKHVFQQERTIRFRNKAIIGTNNGKSPHEILKKPRTRRPRSYEAILKRTGKSSGSDSQTRPNKPKLQENKENAQISKRNKRGVMPKIKFFFSLQALK